MLTHIPPKDYSSSKAVLIMGPECDQNGLRKVKKKMAWFDSKKLVKDRKKSQKYMHQLKYRWYELESFN